MWKLLSLAVFLVAFYPYSTSATCYDEPVPLRVFTNVVRSFMDEAILAEHKCTVDTRTDENGRLFVTFQTTVTCDDVPQKLCNDMYRYINKNGWMTGVTGRCEMKCDQMKLILEGQDDPNYDPNAPVVFVPLQSLADVLSGGFQKAELGDYWTTTETYVDENGRVNILITIVVPDEFQPCVATDVCENVRAYLNKPNILDNSSYTCEFVEGCIDKVLLHFIADY